MHQKSTLYELSSEPLVLFHRDDPRTALRLVHYPSTVYYQISTESLLFQKIILKTNWPLASIYQLHINKKLLIMKISVILISPSP
jgi:hypothetical protein